jgi:hypothetical protein
VGRYPLSLRLPFEDGIGSRQSPIIWKLVNDGGNNDIYGVRYGFAHGAGAGKQPRFLAVTKGFLGAVINRRGILPECLIKVIKNPMN